jgi:hypothetical protein
MQSFLGQINFVKHFISDLTEIVLPLQRMIRKDTLFKWNTIEKYAFNSIKQAIIQAPSLLSPNYDKEFILYTFAYEKSYADLCYHKKMIET